MNTQFSCLKIYIKFLFLIIIVTSCTSDAHKEKTEKVFSAYIRTEPLSLHPQIGGTLQSQLIIRHLFEGLFRLDACGKPIPSLTESYTVSHDQRTYRFVLRKSTSSNGDPVTAHDFAYAWKLLSNPEFPSAYAYIVNAIKNARLAKQGKVPLDDVGIRAIDDNTLEVELEIHAPYFLELLANTFFYPIHHIQTQKDKDWHKAQGPAFISNGPFVLEHWKCLNEIAMKKNNNFWNASSISLDRANFGFVESILTAQNSFERGEIDWLGQPFGLLSSDQITAYHKKALLKSMLLGVYWLQLNTKHPLLRSKKIRRALALAINRKELCQKLLQGGETEAFSIIPEYISRLTHPLLKDADISTAKELFEEGLKDLSLTYETIPKLTFGWGYDQQKLITEAIIGMWKKVFNLPIELIGKDFNNYLMDYRAGELDIAGTSWSLYYSDPTYILEILRETGNWTFNGSQWHSDYFTSLLDQVGQTKETNERDATLAELEKIAIEELPLIPIFYTTSKFVHIPNLKGYVFTSTGGLDISRAIKE